MNVGRRCVTDSMRLVSGSTISAVRYSTSLRSTRVSQRLPPRVRKPMKDPDDTRDIGPRVGSPLWIHLTAGTAAGTVVLAWALPHLGLAGLDHLARNPRFWVIAVLVVAGEVRPIATPGKTGPEAPVVSLAFSF